MKGARHEARGAMEPAEFRVRALLRFPFSPWIREATIAALRADPVTAPFVPAEVGPGQSPNLFPDS